MQNSTPHPEREAVDITSQQGANSVRLSATLIEKESVEPTIADVEITDAEFALDLADGRSIRVPLS
jgi:hypothetical protein